MPQRIAASRVITVARPDFSAGMSAAVKSPLPISSARAEPTMSGKSFVIVTAGRTGSVCSAEPLMLERQAVRTPHHAHQHGNGQQKVRAGGIQRHLAGLR